MESYLIVSSNVPTQNQSCNQTKENKLAQRRKIRDNYYLSCYKTSKWYLGVSDDGHTGIPSTDGHLHQIYKYIYISIKKNGESFFDPNNIFVLIPLPFDAIVIAKIMINQWWAFKWWYINDAENYGEMAMFISSS